MDPTEMQATILIDADACPVKDEAYRVAARYRLPVVLVANRPLGLPDGIDARMVVVARELDAADDWIAENATPGHVVVTADIPLAARCLAAGARVLGVDGRPFDEASIGGALATRELKSQLREVGVWTSGPSTLRQADRSRFLSKLDQLVQEVARSSR